MSDLYSQVTINRRFARSTRLDADLQETSQLIGYVLQESVRKALVTMAARHKETGPGAFTWTGPYGGGQSSAVLLIANPIAGAAPSTKIARKIVGKTAIGSAPV